MRVLLADCGLESDIRRAWDEFEAASTGADGQPARLDGLVCNAGALLNERTLTKEGVEVTLASHFLFGTYLLGSLARTSLEGCPGGGARMLVVSSGGMYNTKWPSWTRAASLPDALVEHSYDGNLAYAFAKRGQVLLCERWGLEAPSRGGDVKYITGHPGWTATPAVDAAYGDAKKYLEPMRTPWEGAEGLVYTLLCGSEELVNGGFYLDRMPMVKHLSGPLFSEGSFTKNTEKEVDEMMAKLEEWSSAATRPPLPAIGSDEDERQMSDARARILPLTAMERPVDLESFMGRWFVIGVIPTIFERGATDCVEDYAYDTKAQSIGVTFTYRPKGLAVDALPSTIEQRATVQNAPTNTKWAICPKLMGLFVPLNLDYLVVDCAEDFSHCMIGVPNRSNLWIMARSPATMDDEAYEKALQHAEHLGFDRSKVCRVPHTH